MRVYSHEIAQSIADQFADAGFVRVWIGASGFIPSPLVRELSRMPADSRALFISMAFPQLPETLSGLGTSAQGLAHQVYEIDVIGLQRIPDKSQRSVPQVQQGLVNVILPVLERWAGNVKNVRIDDSITLSAARTAGGTYEVASPLQQHGWFAAVVRISVVAQVKTS